MTNEPVRKATWITGAIVIVFQTAALILMNTDNWKSALAAGLITASGFVATGEIARAKVLGPETTVAETGKTVKEIGPG